MSIYATQWVLQFPTTGDSYPGCEWVEVIGQGVPAFIGSPTTGYGYEAGDPYSDFLPPAIPITSRDDEARLRAIVIVRDGSVKSGQRYENPLLVLSGAEYAEARFDDLVERICDALRRDGPRWVTSVTGKDGHTRVHFADGSVKELPPNE